MTWLLPTLALAAETSVDVGTGRVSGGWDYVTAAYVVTWSVLLGYVVSLWLRQRALAPTEEP